jgi:pimeloyl-ACP methyl ester carboxylesterase
MSGARHGPAVGRGDEGDAAPSLRSALSGVGSLAEEVTARGREGGRAVERAARSVLTAVRSRVTPRMVAGIAVEAAWVTTHLATYPIGIVAGRGTDVGHGYRIEHLPPLQRGLVISDIVAAGTPILLVHGLIDNRSVFTLLRLGLTRRGFGRVFAMNYSSLTHDVRTAAARLGEEIESIVEETGYERIHVVGHSLGGLIARYYVTRLGGDSRVHTLVTLGTPHRGTYTAYVVPTRLTRQLRPGSPLMTELEQPAPGCRTRFIVYWSDADQMVLPQRNAALHHDDLMVRNIALHGVGHVSLPIVRDVVHGISVALAQLEHDGSTMTEGATPLLPARRA